jgi:hypothetical protein
MDWAATAWTKTTTTSERRSAQIDRVIIQSEKAKLRGKKTGERGFVRLFHPQPTQIWTRLSTFLTFVERDSVVCNVFSLLPKTLLRMSSPRSILCVFALLVVASSGSSPSRIVSFYSLKFPLGREAQKSRSPVLRLSSSVVIPFGLIFLRTCPFCRLFCGIILFEIALFAPFF